MRAASAWLCLLALGCGDGDPHTLDWECRFSDDTLRTRAAVIEATVVTGGCDGVRELYRAELVRGGSAPAPPGLSPGTYGLICRARDGMCIDFASGCTEVELPTDGTVSVAMATVPEIPGCPSGMCMAGLCGGGMDAGGVDAFVPPVDGCPADPEICDTIDNDCDGLFDEDFDLTTDPMNCGACGNACTDTLCSGGMCTTPPDAVVGAAGGGEHTCALLASGDVYCWGLNDAGQLGDGSIVSRPTPGRVTGLDDALAITAGANFTCVLRSTGRAWCWGGNVSGQLGDGSTVDRDVPTEVNGFRGVPRLIRGGGFHACAIRGDQTVGCWGWNSAGQLGNGDTMNRLVPTSVPGLSSIVDLSANFQSTCAVDASGTARCWGENDQGQIGDGTTSAMETRPTTVDLRLPAARIDVGVNHACAILNDQSVRCWGDGQFGQLGNGTMSDRARPDMIIGPADFAEIDAAAQFTCGRRVSGQVQCWGFGGEGAIGDGTGASRVTPGPVTGITTASALGEDDSGAACAIVANELRCWGDNANGQIGDGTMADATTPVVVPIP